MYFSRVRTGGRSQLSTLNSRRHSARGFALLLTLIIVSVIGVVAFSVGRLTLSEFRQGLRFQDSQDALQAAEAGIEDGLVRFRFNRDSEVPVQYDYSTTPPTPNNPYSCANTAETTHDTTLVLRVNLTAKRTDCINPTITAAPSPTDHVYDLKMYYKGTQLGTLDSTNKPTSDSPTIKKDGTLQISGLDPTSSASLQLWYSLSNAVSTAGDQRGEIQFINTGGAIIGTQIIHQSDENRATSNAFGFLVRPLAGTTSVKLKPFAGDDTLVIKYVGSAPLDFGFTNIVVAGYYNGVKRSLNVAINRASGTVTGTGNFVLFAPGGGINQAQ